MVAIAALLLMAEGLSTSFRLASRLPVLAIYPLPTLGLIGARFAVALLQFAGGWLLLGRRLPGPALAQTACAASAGLRALELGVGLAPTSVFPSYRWPVVAGYAIYAAALAAVVRRRTRVPLPDDAGGDRADRQAPGA